MSRVVAKKLRETRESQNLTIVQAAQATHIRQRYIEALELGDFEVLPSRLQVKGFIRSYAGYLGIPAEPLIAALDRESWEALATIQSEPVSDEPETEPEETAPEIVSRFVSVGQTLQNQRQILGLSLDEIASHTHLKIGYLQALESGDIQSLPSPVQGRGMLKNYATFLGLNADEILLQFAEGLQNRRAETFLESEQENIRPKKRPKRRERRFFSRDVLIGSALALFMVVFIIWGAFQVTEIRSEALIEPTAPSIADVLLPSETPTLVPTTTPTLADPLDSEIEAAVPLENQPETADEDQGIIFVSESFEGPVQVQIVVRQRAWMRITVDEEIEFDGRVIPGSAYAFAGTDYIEITTGNGAGLQVIYNDLDLGVLGDYGEVIDFVITINGVQTPTPTLTFTATETPAVTLTPTPVP
jgi:cytoskeleton protein RodZ